MSLQEERYISVGKVGAPYGLEGAVKVISFTEHPEDIFEYSPWHIHKNGQWLEILLQGEEVQGKYLIAKFAGCEGRDMAQHWTNCGIAIKRSQLPELPPGKYYWSDLEELEVKTISGLPLGQVKEVMETGANPVLVIEGSQRHLVPYVPEKIVKEVNLASKYLVVDWDPDF